MARLILASTSKFRQEILLRTGLPFASIAPVCDETPLADETPEQTATRLAVSKASSLAAHYPDALIIGSDQVAWVAGQQLGKPASLPQAVAMLQLTSGREVEFHTALAVLHPCEQRLLTACDLTRVKMRQFDQERIHRYLEREPDALYCAGAAKSEGLGGALIESIDSRDPNALIGLPLFALISMLSECGVEVI